MFKLNCWCHSSGPRPLVLLCVCVWGGEVLELISMLIGYYFDWLLLLYVCTSYEFLLLVLMVNGYWLQI